MVKLTLKNANIQRTVSKAFSQTNLKHHAWIEYGKFRLCCCCCCGKVLDAHLRSFIQPLREQTTHRMRPDWNLEARTVLVFCVTPKQRFSDETTADDNR